MKSESVCRKTRRAGRHAADMHGLDAMTSLRMRQEWVPATPQMLGTGMTGEVMRVAQSSMLRMPWHKWSCTWCSQTEADSLSRKGVNYDSSAHTPMLQ